MFRFLSVSVLSLSLLTHAHAGDSPDRLATSFEIKQDLFSSLFSEGDATFLSSQSNDLAVQKKSVGLAVLYSLLVPGLGEYYAGDYSLGKFLTGAEVGLWITYLTFDVYGSSLKDDARSFAVSHSGMNPSGKSDQFYVDVSNFMNTQEFNDKRLRERSPERLYDASAGEHWQWDSDANRALFREQRISADNVLNNRKFVVTAIVINHVISAINAARVAISHNKSIPDESGSLQFKANVLGGLMNPHGVALTVSKNL